MMEKRDAENFSLDENGVEKFCEEAVTVTGDVHLILAGGCNAFIVATSVGNTAG